MVKLNLALKKEQPEYAQDKVVVNMTMLGSLLQNVWKNDLENVKWNVRKIDTTPINIRETDTKNKHNINETRIFD